MPAHSAIAKIMGVDEVVLCKLLTDVTDLQQSTLQVFVKKRSDLEVIIEAVFQLPPTLKMLPPLQIIPVFERFMIKHYDDIGSPWDDCVAKGAVNKVTGALNPFLCPAYTAQFDTGGNLKTLTHRSGDKVDCNCNFTKESKIRNVWSDWRCCWPNPPAPDVKMHVFFKKEKKGPYSADNIEYAPKAKHYITAVDTAYHVWRSVKTADQAKDDLVKAVQSGKEARAADARVKAKHKMDSARDVGLEALKKGKQSLMAFRPEPAEVSLLVHSGSGICAAILVPLPV